MPPARPICSSSALRVSAIDSPPCRQCRRPPDNNSRPWARNFRSGAHRLARSSVLCPEPILKSAENETMAEHSETISTLNTLIATTIDSINGYENSAKDVENERFREIFRQRADERQRV